MDALQGHAGTGLPARVKIAWRCTRGDVQSGGRFRLFTESDRRIYKETTGVPRRLRLARILRQRAKKPPRCIGITAALLEPTVGWRSVRWQPHRNWRALG